jgi:1-acyl-sn-glycerol-3-phosphate acyltransferase
MQKWFSYFWYWLCWYVSGAALILGFSFRVEGSRRVPRKGGVLIIGNHQSFFDPIAMGVATPTRRVTYLARKTLFRPAWFGWLISSLNAVPVDQEGVAKEGLKTVLTELQKGEAVIMFPEGTRTDTGEMSPLKPGIQLLIKRADVKVVPMGVAGAFEAMPYWEKVPKLSPLFLPARDSTIAVWVGEPLDSRELAKLSRQELLATLTEVLQDAYDRAKKLRRKA